MSKRTIIIYLILFLSFIITRGVGQFSFVHVSDIHVSNVVSLVNNCDTGGHIFSQMLANISDLNPKPDFVVASGDISNIGNSGDGMYTTLTQYLFPYPLTN